MSDDEAMTCMFCGGDVWSVVSRREIQCDECLAIRMVRLDDDPEPEPAPEVTP